MIRKLNLCTLQKIQRKLHILRIYTVNKYTYIYYTNFIF